MKIGAMISFKNYFTFADTEVFLRDYQVDAEAVWFEAPNYGFGGDFDISGSVAASVDRVLGNLEEDLLKAEETRNAKLINRLRMMIEAFRDEEAKIYGLEVEAKLKELQKIEGDSRVRLVDVTHYPETPAGARVFKRPILPGERE